MIRLSVPLRQALSRLSLPVLIAMAFGTMLLGKADALLAERARMALADALTPIWAVLHEPVGAVRDTLREAETLFAMRGENARLREENARLHRWQAAALALEAENAMLRRQLAFVPEAAPAYHHRPRRRRWRRHLCPGRAARRRAEPCASRKGQVALDERGLAGRVTEVGTRSARVVLATDINSRIPVVLEGSRARAMMVGTNGARPRLQYWPAGTKPQEGDRVVTSAEANAFPAGLPVGVVRWTASGAAEVELFARLDRLDVLRLFDYGMGGILPPEAVARPEPRAKR